jgi:DNA-binding protein HU-beta
MARNPKKARKIAVFRAFRLYKHSARLYHETRKAAFRERLAAHISRQENRFQRSIMASTRMTQAQLVTALSEAGGVTKAQAKNILTSLSDIAVKETKKNGEFVIPGIGKLVRRETKARMGRNPATGEAIKIPAKKVVKFRVAKAMKDSIVPPKKK